MAKIVLGVWIDPVVGRIDHAKNYSFDNIEILERTDNSSERVSRCGQPNPKDKKTLVCSPLNDQVIAEFESAKACADFFEVGYYTIRNNAASGTKPQKLNFIFRYA